MPASTFLRHFLDRFLLYTKELNSFLKHNGIFAWGVVPTEAFNQTIKPQVLAEKIDSALEKLEKKGISAEALKKSMLLTPSCGLGALDSKKAEQILNCLAELSSSFKARGH